MSLLILPGLADEGVRFTIIATSFESMENDYVKFGYIERYRNKQLVLMSPSLLLCLVPSPDSLNSDEYQEVYVSASEHPNHFWIQILEPCGHELDTLINDMTEYYDNTLVSCCKGRLGWGFPFSMSNVPFFPYS